MYGDNLTFLKLGGSLITEKGSKFTAKEEVIRRIAGEIKKARDKNPGMRLAIGHGGGSFPHYPAEKYKVAEGIINKDSWKGFSRTRAAASKLNQTVTEIFIDEGLDVVSFQPSSTVVCEDGEIVQMDLTPAKHLLDEGQIPITYGDAVLDRDKGCTIVSTEKLLEYMARHMFPSRLIISGKVEGVFEDDPHENPDVELIDEITEENIEDTKEKLGGSHGHDVTGGMLTKTMRMYGLVERIPTAEVRIISGLKEGRIRKALDGQDVRGTRIYMQEENEVPKVLAVEVDGIIVDEGFKPWKELLERTVNRGLIDRKTWENDIHPVAEGYLSEEVDRDEAVKIVMSAAARALEGVEYSRIRDVAENAMEKVRENYDQEVLDILDLAKKRGYRLATISSNFKETAELIADDIDADYVYDTGFEVKDGIITGRTEGEFMTSAGKLKALKDMEERTGAPKERITYMGKHFSDWRALNRSGKGILFEPELDKEEGMRLEEKEWIDKVDKLVETDEIANIMIITNRKEVDRIREEIK